MQPRVLLIDDDLNILDAYQRTLRRRFQIDVAEGPRAGLSKILSGEPYAVVVADMLMPGISGLDILRKLKEFSPNTVGLLITGLQDANLAFEALNEGIAHRFLQKPATTDRVIRAIQECLEYHQLLAAQDAQRRQCLEPLLLAASDQLTELQNQVYGRSLSLARFLRQISEQLKLPNPGDFEMAGALAGLGWCSAPAPVQRKQFGINPTDETVPLTLLEHETQFIKKLSQTGPLSEILAMVRRPNLPWQQCVAGDSLLACVRIEVGGHLLGCAREFCQVYLHSGSQAAAMVRMRGRRDFYHQQLLESLEALHKNRLLAAG